MDLKKYSTDPKKKYHCDYYKYELSGVIIQNGTINNGHYWTWVKNQEKWIRISDTEVIEFKNHSAVFEEGSGGQMAVKG